MVNNKKNNQAGKISSDVLQQIAPGLQKHNANINGNIKSNNGVVIQSSGNVVISGGTINAKNVAIVADNIEISNTSITAESVIITEKDAYQLKENNNNINLDNLIEIDNTKLTKKD